MWCTIQEVLVGARISGARGATWSQKGSGTQAKTFSFKMLKFLLRNLFWVARNRENTESILKCNFCPRGTKVDLPQGLIFSEPGNCPSSLKKLKIILFNSLIFNLNNCKSAQFSNCPVWTTPKKNKIVLLDRLSECKLLYIYNKRWQIALLIFIPGFRIPERSHPAATSVYNPFNKNIIIYSNVNYIQYITVLNNS